MYGLDDNQWPVLPGEGMSSQGPPQEYLSSLNAGNGNESCDSYSGNWGYDADPGIWNPECYSMSSLALVASSQSSAEETSVQVPAVCVDARRAGCAASL